MISDTEADCRAACRAIETGNWKEAYEICDRLSRQPALSLDLIHAANVMKDILDPANTPDETAEKITRFMPGRVIRISVDETS